MKLLPAALIDGGAAAGAGGSHAANAVFDVDDGQSRWGSPPELANHFVAGEPVVGLFELVSDE